MTAVHAAVLPTGKVLWYSYPKLPVPSVEKDPPNTTRAWLWDPATGAQKRVDPPLWTDPVDGKVKPVNIWCSGQSHMADGRLLVTGGNLAYRGVTSAPKGLDRVYTFNPFNETWTEQPRMRKGRWYPTNVLLPDGRTVIMDGYDASGNYATAENFDIEIFTPSSNLDGRGTVSLLGTRSTPGQPPHGGLYPHMFGMPSGRTLVAGPDPLDTWFLNAPGPGTTFSWRDAPNTLRNRLWGSAVLVPGGTRGSTNVMQLGGAAPQFTANTSVIPTPTTETFDEANVAAGWRPASSLHIGRAHHNTVLLPDGSMVTVGGGVGVRNGDQWAVNPEQRHIELWNPSTRTWTLGPEQVKGRSYHSIAMLLPDGRVVSAGDERERRGQRGHGRDLRASLPVQGPAADDQLGARERAVRIELRCRYPQHRRQARRARYTQRGDPRQ